MVLAVWFPPKNLHVNGKGDRDPCMFISMKLLEFKIPRLPPSVNAMYKISGKKLYKTEEVKKFQKVLLETFFKRPRIAVPIALLLEFHIKQKVKYSRRDLDNFLKATIDGLQMSGQIKNDNNIIFLCACKVQDGKNFVKGEIHSMRKHIDFIGLLKYVGLYASIGSD